MRAVVSPKAYKKALLHSTKYPHHAVSGVLLGKRVPDDSQKDGLTWKKAAHLPSGSIFITDYLPLFHGHTLAPMLEAGFMLAEEYAQKHKLMIVGFCHANELYDDRQLGVLAKRIGGKIEKNTPGSCILLLDPELVCEKAFALRGFVRQHDHWEERNTQFGLFKEDTFKWAELETFLERNVASFYDFDNHLDDISKDWFNRGLGKKK